jgi:amidase
MDKATKSLPFDVLTATATELRDLLQAGQKTSAEIAHAYLAQIEKHNRAGLGLRAIISTAPRQIVLSQASKLDE